MGQLGHRARKSSDSATSWRPMTLKEQCQDGVHILVYI